MRSFLPATVSIVTLTAAFFAGRASVTLPPAAPPIPAPAALLAIESVQEPVEPTVIAIAKAKSGVVMLTAFRRSAYPDHPPIPVSAAGVIVGPDLIVTATHVIATADRVSVRFVDGQEMEATVVGNFPAKELAFLRVKAKSLTPLVLAERAPAVGETMIAIGNPFAYRWTATTGIVSATGREIGMPSGVTLQGLIQTSATLNPGNSGGPLLNLEGECVGINVAIRDGGQSLGFTVPVADVRAALLAVR